MPIKGTWREKLNNINDYDRLVEMNKNIREHHEENYSICIMDGFMSMEDCQVRCSLYSEHCNECIQDFLNEKAR